MFLISFLVITISNIFILLWHFSLINTISYNNCFTWSHFNVPEMNNYKKKEWVSYKNWINYLLNKGELKVLSENGWIDKL
jgi:hypothetical protein